MKNKKGFTLVELLAVIAILAILMLLIMPNALKSFNKGGKNAFKVQVQKIIKAAETQLQSDAIAGKSVIGYCDGIDNGLCTSDMKLDVSGSDAKYALMFNNDGKVAGIVVEDSNYCYVNVSDVTNIDTDDFVAGAHLSCTETTCTCEGSSE